MKKIRSITDLYAVAKTAQHVLTLFSGGLDSTYVLEALKGKNLKVTALAVDLGDDIDQEKLSKIAKHYGINLIILDAKVDFVELSLISAIQSQAYYFGDYPVSSSLSRPIIVKKAVELAQELKCDAIIHTANQSQNSLRRLNGSIEASDFEGYYGSPYEYSVLTREDKAQALIQSGLHDFGYRNISGDSNLWCREFESGSLDDPESFNIPENLYTWSQWNPELHLKENELKVTFFKGYPISVNDTPMGLIDLIHYLNTHAGAYEIGRYIGFDHLDQDEKVLEIREAPAATILMKAYKLLETATIPTDVLKTKALHNNLWTQEAVEGRWGSMLQQASYAFIAFTAEKVSGSVNFKLSRGQSQPNSIIAQEPMYLRDRENWEAKVAMERSSNAIDTLRQDTQNIISAA